MTEIIYPELSYKVTGLCMKTQEKVGRFGKEKQYADALEILLKQEGVPYRRETPLAINIGNGVVGGNVADFVIADIILLEIKAVPFLRKQDFYQTMRYLEAANLRLGLLVNFRSRYLKPKRILNARAVPA